MATAIGACCRRAGATAGVAAGDTACAAGVDVDVVVLVDADVVVLDAAVAGVTAGSAATSCQLPANVISRTRYPLLGMARYLYRAPALLSRDRHRASVSELASRATAS
jgi:hypothetical protein